MLKSIFRGSGKWPLRVEEKAVREVWRRQQNKAEGSPGGRRAQWEKERREMRGQ